MVIKQRLQYRHELNYDALTHLNTNKRQTDSMIATVSVSTVEKMKSHDNISHRFLPKAVNEMLMTRQVAKAPYCFSYRFKNVHDIQVRQI